jgi:hypothetical protein
MTLICLSSLAGGKELVLDLLMRLNIQRPATQFAKSGSAAAASVSRDYWNY